MYHEIQHFYDMCKGSYLEGEVECESRSIDVYKNRKEECVFGRNLTY